MSARDRSILAVLALVVVAVLGYFVVIQPAHHKADQLNSQIASQRSALTAAESQVQSGLAAEAQYRAYAKQLKSIEAAVPSDAQIPTLINELQAASTRNRVGFQTVSASGQTAAAAAATGSTAASFPSESFSLTFTGNYFAVTNLLDTLNKFVRADNKRFEASGRLLSVQSVALSPGGSGTSAASSSSGVVTATVTALDYDIPTALLASGGSSASSTTTSGG